MGRGNGESITARVMISRFTNVSTPVIVVYRQCSLYIAQWKYAPTRLEARVHAHRVVCTHPHARKGIARVPAQKHASVCWFASSSDVLAQTGAGIFVQISVRGRGRHVWGNCLWITRGTAMPTVAGSALCQVCLERQFYTLVAVRCASVPPNLRRCSRIRRSSCVYSFSCPRIWGQ